MTNKELLRAGLIGSAVLLFGGGLAIYRLTEYQPAAASREWREAEKESAQREDGIPKLSLPPESGAPSPVFGDGAKPREAVPMEVYSPARVARGPKAQVAAKDRREALRNARGELIEGFTLLRKRVEKCGAQEASFILSLEALDGAVRVERARVEVQGAAPSAAVACAEAELSGQVFTAPSLVAGRRWEVTF